MAAVLKQLVLVVDGTSAMGPFWDTIVEDYLKKIVRYMCGNGAIAQEPFGAIVELGLVQYCTNGPYNYLAASPTGWTRDVERYFDRLKALKFNGSGLDDRSIAEGLADALVMLQVLPQGYRSQQNFLRQKHCILIVAGNPFSLPTPMNLPRLPPSKFAEICRIPVERHLSNAESVAKLFAEAFISLSVISPRQLPKLREIYNAGNFSINTADLSFNAVTNPNYLVLLSERFPEAHAALNERPEFELDLSEEDVIFLQQLLSEPVATQQHIPAESIPMETVQAGHMASSSMAPQGFSRMSSVSQTHLPSFDQTETAGFQHTYHGIFAYANPMVKPIQMPPLACFAAEIGESSGQHQDAQNFSGSYYASGPLMGVQQTGISRPTIPPEPVRRTSMNAQNTTDGSFSSNLSGNFNMMSQPAEFPTMYSGIRGSPHNPVMLSPSVQPNALSQPVTAGNNITAVSFAATIARGLSGNANIPQPYASFQGPVAIGYPQSMINQGYLSRPNVEQSEASNRHSQLSALNQFSTSSGAGSLLPVVGMPQQADGDMLSFVMNDALKDNLEQLNGYVKAWQGTITALMSRQIVLLSRAVAYRMISAPEGLTFDWPPAFQLGHIMSQEIFEKSTKQSPKEFVIFEIMAHHSIFQRLTERKLCSKVNLPFQKMMFSPTSKECRFVGTVFPGNPGI